MTDRVANGITPQTALPEAVVPPPSVGQSLEQSLNKLGQAAQETARDLGAVAGKAADEAAAKLNPVAESAVKTLDATARDLGIAASTVKQGCADVANSAWSAIASGNFGQASDAIKATAGTCADSFGASLMAIVPWVN